MKWVASLLPAGFLLGLFFNPEDEATCSSKTLLIFSELHGVTRARMAQSVWRLAMGWMTKGSELESWWGQEFSLLHVIQTGSGAHSASYPMGTRGTFPRVKQPGREADHSSPTSSKVKKMWLYTSTPLYIFMV
jgi:hypothetical protein